MYGEKDDSHIQFVNVQKAIMWSMYLNVPPSFIAHNKPSTSCKLKQLLRHMIVLFEEDIEKLKEAPPETETTVVPSVNTVEDTARNC